MLERKIKIVLIAEAMLGGIRQHVCDILMNLDQNQFEPYLIYSSVRADQTFWDQKQQIEQHAQLLECNEMKRELGSYDWRAYRKLVQLLNQIKPDLVHCHSSKAGIVGRLAARRCKIRAVVYTPNAYAFQAPEISWWKRSLYIWGERFLTRYLTSVTVNVSKGEQQQARRYGVLGKSRIELIYNGIADLQLPDRTEIRTLLGYSSQDTLIGVTARCAEQKDPMTFLRIAGLLIEKRKDIHFLYLGDGPMEEQMKKWVWDHQLESRIHLLGFRPDAGVLVAGLDIYLSTARYEGLPYSMIEAMRAGVPIIATDVVGNNELVQNGKNGLLFEAGNITQGARMVELQLEQQTISREQVKQSFQQRFSLPSMMKKLSALYQELAKKEGNQ